MESFSGEPEEQLEIELKKVFINSRCSGAPSFFDAPAPKINTFSMRLMT